MPPPGLPKLTGNRRGSSPSSSLNAALTKSRSPSPKVPAGPRKMCDDAKKEGDTTKSGTILKPTAQKEYKNGGKVKTTGNAKLHKNEVVLPVHLVKKLERLMK